MFTFIHLLRLIVCSDSKTMLFYFHIFCSSLRNFRYGKQNKRSERCRYFSRWLFQIEPSIRRADELSLLLNPIRLFIMPFEVENVISVLLEFSHCFAAPFSFGLFSPRPKSIRLPLYYVREKSSNKKKERMCALPKNRHIRPVIFHKCMGIYLNDSSIEFISNDFGSHIRLSIYEHVPTMCGSVLLCVCYFGWMLLLLFFIPSFFLRFTFEYFWLLYP